MVDPRKDKSYDKTEWMTPLNVFRKIEKFMSEYFYVMDFKFTLDPCTTHNNLKVPKYFTKKEDGLKQSWKDEIVFVNPPYGPGIDDWIMKSYEESKYNNAIVVMLLSNFTDTKIFHQIILKYAEVVFIEGRISFVGSKGSPREGSILAIFDNQSHRKYLRLTVRGLS